MTELASKTTSRDRSIRARLASACLVLALVGGACSVGRSDRLARSMQLRMINGSATLVREGKAQTVRKDINVAAGDSLVLSRGGVAELRLAKGRVLELRDARVELTSDTALRLSRGSILSDIQAPLDIDLESSRLSADRGTFRVDRALSTRVGNYAGEPITVRAGSSSLAIPAYRQTVVAGGIIPKVVAPLRINRKDPWDQRLVSEALDLEQRLVNFARGLEAQLGPSSGIEFFRAVAPLGLDVVFLEPVLGSRRSDVLIGLLLAVDAKVGSANPVQSRFEKIFDLWNDGASWGLLAMEFGVPQDGLFSRLLQAVEKAGIRVAGPGPALIRARRQPTQGTSSAAPRQAPSSGTGQSVSPSPTRNNIPGTNTPPPTTGSTHIDDVVDDLLGRLP